MFVRVKSTPNSPRRAVQLVEGIRRDGKVRQRIVCHIGVACDDDELRRLKELGEILKAGIEQRHQPSLFPPEPVVTGVLAAKPLQPDAGFDETGTALRLFSLR